jgi:hypothetical protein
MNICACGCGGQTKATWCRGHNNNSQREVLTLTGPPFACWLYGGTLTPDGYGNSRFAGTNERYVHRAAWELANGPIPAGMTIDHLCRVRSCYNPSHLEPVTKRENTLRGIGPTAVHARQTHCIRGHEFTPENTATDHRGGRRCRACTALWARENRPSRARKSA